MSSFRRILVGWDGSQDAEHALRTASHLAEVLGAEVVVLAVLQRHPTAEAVDEADEELAKRRLAALNDMEQGAEQAGLSAGLRLHNQVIEASNPAAALSQHAVEHGFDLVVVGRHGLDRAVHPRVGGVTEHQVRHSSCPVLVVGDD